jgi:hypothetical protein
VDAHLATYDASGAVSGIDDRSILAIVISAIKDLWSKVLALIESDEAQNARIKQLEEEVAALKAAAGAPGLVSGVGAPSGSSTSSGGDADTATTTTSANDEEDADAPEQGGTEAPATAAPEGESDALGSADGDSDTADAYEPPPATDAVSSPSSTEPANDNSPADPLPATGTE